MNFGGPSLFRREGLGSDEAECLGRRSENWTKAKSSTPGLTAFVPGQDPSPFRAKRPVDVEYVKGVREAADYVSEDLLS